MKNENDLIAEFVKEKYPELLTTLDFAIFRISKVCQQIANDIFDSFKNIDISELKKLADDFNSRME